MGFDLLKVIINKKITSQLIVTISDPLKSVEL